MPRRLLLSSQKKLELSCASCVDESTNRIDPLVPLGIELPMSTDAAGAASHAGADPAPVAVNKYPSVEAASFASVVVVSA